jgi:hypothetical protein
MTENVVIHKDDLRSFSCSKHRFIAVVWIPKDSGARIKQIILSLLVLALESLDKVVNKVVVEVLTTQVSVACQVHIDASFDDCQRESLSNP